MCAFEFLPSVIPTCWQFRL